MTFISKIEAAKKLIKESIEKYPNICVGASFGKDSTVLVHLIKEVKPDIPVFNILADTEFQETYDFSRKTAKDWNLNYKEYFFEQDDKRCCGEPKVEKTKEALREYDAWFSGVRMTEGITRANFKEVEERDGLVKINPLLYFTELDIWRYLAVNDISVNPLYKKGFRSLGCSLCTFPETDENETERSGRWKGTANECGECGIHSKSLR